jgi:hypothetical protein
MSFSVSWVVVGIAIMSAFASPTMATHHAGMLGRSSMTCSPRSMPSARIALAKRLESLDTSANDSRFSSPSLPTHQSAHVSGRSSAQRSTTS